MKVAIVRAASVNDWELQSYLPLAKYYYLTVFGSWINEYPFTLPLHVNKLLCLGNLFGKVPGGIKFLYRHFGDPQVLVGLEKALIGYDIVDTVERTNYYTLQAIRAKKQRLIKKVVVHCWENLLHTRQNYQAQKEMKEEVDRHADLFIAGTKGAREVLLKEGIPKYKITVVPFGIDTNHFVLPHKDFKKDVTVLFAARMTKAKGVYVLYDAAKQIIQTHKVKDVSFVFMGEGDEKARLRNQIQRDNLKRWIRIANFVPYNRLREMYWRSEMLVLPSSGSITWVEQFGLVLTEAMASGTAVIGSNLGSIPEIIADCGLLFNNGDSRELARQILRLYKNQKLKRELVYTARKRVVRYYSVKAVSTKLDRIYRQI